VELDRLDADAQRLRDGPRRSPAQHFDQHLALPLRQRRDSVLGAVRDAQARRKPILVLRRHPQRAAGDEHEARGIVRLFQEVDRRVLHRPHDHGHIAVGSQEDDGLATAPLVQCVLQLKAAHSGHAHVEDESASTRSPAPRLPVQGIAPA
jgi:hypothetical protein